MTNGARTSVRIRHPDFSPVCQRRTRRVPRPILPRSVVNGIHITRSADFSPHQAPGLQSGLSTANTMGSTTDPSQVGRERHTHIQAPGFRRPTPHCSDCRLQSLLRHSSNHTPILFPRIFVYCDGKIANIEPITAALLSTRNPEAGSRSKLKMVVLVSFDTAILLTLIGDRFPCPVERHPPNPGYAIQ